MRSVPQRGIDVLVADDDEAMRFLLVTALGALPGVGSVVAAADGTAAVDVGRTRRLDVAVLDVQMPRIDGIEAAGRLLELQPWLRIALGSSDSRALGERGRGLGLPLFDKLRIDELFDWVGGQASAIGAGPRSVMSPVPLRTR